ncbi:MAG: AIR synthase-related protein [Hymenobacter sp.]
MKNDFKADGVKISVPPTVLYSMTAKMEDVRQRRYLRLQAGRRRDLPARRNPRRAGRLGVLRTFTASWAPTCRRLILQQAKELYILVGEANDQQLIQSCHDLSDGGLAVALAECTFGYEVRGPTSTWAVTWPGELPLPALLFSESHSRFVVSVAPEDVCGVREHSGGTALPAWATSRTMAGCACITPMAGGQSRPAPATLRTAWTNGPVNQTIGLEAGHVKLGIKS